MKIAVTSQGPYITSEADPRFGRTAYFMVFDDCENTWNPLNNSNNLHTINNAGIQAAKTMEDNRVDVVITGNIGPKALFTLRQANIELYIGALGTVEQCLQQWRLGKLEHLHTHHIHYRVEL